MKRSEIIYADGRVESVEPRDGKRFTMKELQDIVGGYFEYVRIDSKKVMVVNEEGRLRGLPYNPTASFVALRTIVGNVLVCDNAMA